MKCFTANAGVVTEGIRLTKEIPASAEGKTRFFVHVNPDHFGEVHSVDALLSSGCAHMEEGDVVVDRCIYVNGDLQPEVSADGKALVLGGIDHNQAVFTGSVDEPATYRTAIGPNLYFHAVVSRHLNRVMGHSTGHEQFVFLGIFEDGDCIKANVIFQNEAGATIDLWADGVLLSFNRGHLRFHEVAVVTQAERFTARR